ncbi:MAG TPA: alpha-hydroxy acid oxidase [Candidatus Sulfopaludibacter sp.]|jgi:isopentenyl diphosphate isomerase/L-lactate dehydrogenase-like FMN-dependent dehydrogenase|nr:alpha-hydroxy acid oxidase [Candidatus Sulfopaludibacter sp.]
MQNSRREFLSFLAASPLALAQSESLKTPQDALSVLDFEEAARRTLPIAHFAYITTGVDDDATLKANRDGFKKIQLRPRRLVDVSKVDTSIDLFGTKWASPIYVCPCGSQRAFHPEGELATARAAKSRKALQMLSTVSSTPVEAVAEALGRPPWYQLYAPAHWDGVQKLVRRVETAGCQTIVLTVDQNAGRNTETQMRLSRADTRQCSTCHNAAPGPASKKSRPMFEGIDSAGYNPPSATWELVDRLKNATRLKVFIKGLETHEDAELACSHGADGIVVSNHGGRALETGRGTIECLPEVIAAVRGRIPVFVDGGFRRGTDVFKALALGARAVGIGRPYLWGLGAFGQPGVERVLDVINAELMLAMRQCGTPSIAEITRASLV